MITPGNYIEQNKEVFAGEIDNETVMMHIQTGKYYGLDDIGSRIWKMAEEKIRVKEIIVKLMEEFDVDEQQCEKDVIELLNDMKANDLIRVE